MPGQAAGLATLRGHPPRRIQGGGRSKRDPIGRSSCVVRRWREASTAQGEGCRWGDVIIGCRAWLSRQTLSTRERTAWSEVSHSRDYPGVCGKHRRGVFLA